MDRSGRGRGRGRERAGRSGRGFINGPSFASAPVTEAEFSRLSAEHQLLLMLEKELHSTPEGGCPQSREGDTEGAASASREQSNKRSHPGGGCVDDEGESESAKRRRGSVGETTTDDWSLQASLLDSSLNVTMLTHSQCAEQFNPFLDLCPAYIILLDPDVTIIRMIEAYQADMCNGKEHTPVTKVFFLMYEESIEEHRYGESLKREKKSFEDLIMKKAGMVVALPEFSTAALSGAGAGAEQDSRRGNSNTSCSSTSRVVVDIREFGSSLPSLLHLHHINIFPVTLLVSLFSTQGGAVQFRSLSCSDLLTVSFTFVGRRFCAFSSDLRGEKRDLGLVPVLCLWSPLLAGRGHVPSLQPALLTGRVPAAELLLTAEPE